MVGGDSKFDLQFLSIVSCQYAVVGGDSKFDLQLLSIVSNCSTHFCR